VIGKGLFGGLSTSIIAFGVWSAAYAQSGTVGNIAVANTCRQASDSVAAYSFTVQSAVREPDKYSEIIVNRFASFRTSVIEARRSLEIVAGPETHAFLFASTDRLAQIQETGGVLFSLRGTEPSTENLEQLAAFAIDAEEVNEAMTVLCRADFLGEN
jgi:hypothetical protein